MQLDNKDRQLETGSNLGKVESYIGQYYDATLSNEDRIKTALEIQRLISTLTNDEKAHLQETIDRNNEQVETGEETKVITPLERAISWAPTRANLRVIDAARESLADDEGHIAAHHKNKPRIAEGLELAKKKRDNKRAVVDDDSALAGSKDIVPDKIDVSFPGPEMPDINLSDASADQAAPSVDEGAMTGASRALGIDGDRDSVAVPLATNVAIPAESIQADDGRIPPTIETAKSEAGRPVEVDPIHVAEVVPNILTSKEIEDINVTGGDKAIGDREIGVPDVAEIQGVHEKHLSQVAIPVIPEEAQGSGLFSFFKKLIPHGDAGADQFKMAEAVAEKRGKTKSNITIEEAA